MKIKTNNRRRIVAAGIGALMLASSSIASAAPHDPKTIALARLHAVCALASMDCSDADPIIDAVFAGLDRAGGGVSYDDQRDTVDAPIDVAVGSYYFAPRVLQVDPGQIVRFVNTSGPGGNRHRVSSSDWGSVKNLGSPQHAAFPVAGPLSFGGGSFSSGVLQPGDSWEWDMPARGERSPFPESGVPLGIDKVLIPYHCNLHGSGTMNGYLLLSTSEY